MTDEEHLREVIREREHTIKALHGNADAMERRIWELEARAEAAEEAAKHYPQVAGENIRLRAALERIANYEGTYVGGTIFMTAVAREALEDKP